MPRVGFETERYLDSQKRAFQGKIDKHPDVSHLIEFGGKPFDDQHAARVLQGYEADCKAEILRSLMPRAKMIMVVNARDVLFPPEGRYQKGRIRGDSQLFYRQEVLRLILRGRELGIRVDETVISITPAVLNESKNQHVLDDLQNALASIGVNSRRFYSIAKYPAVEDDCFNQYADTFEQNGQIASDLNEGVTVFSPGGGSGKFGVLLSEAYFHLKAKAPPFYIKFETFPIFDLDAEHALNLAFTVATADLKNKVISLGENHSTYDKDVENFALLKWLFQRMGFAENLNYMQDPTEIGINRIVDGITDWNIIVESCREEIARRIARHSREATEGIDSVETLTYVQQLAQLFEEKYPSQRKIFSLSNG